MSDAAFDEKMQKLRAGVASDLWPLVEFAGGELVARLTRYALAIGLPPLRAEALARRLARNLVMDFVQAHRFERQFPKNGQ